MAGLDVAAPFAELGRVVDVCAAASDEATGVLVAAGVDEDTTVL